MDLTHMVSVGRRGSSSASFSFPPLAPCKLSMSFIHVTASEIQRSTSGASVSQPPGRHRYIFPRPADHGHALNSTEEGFRQTCKEVFGVDTAGKGGLCQVEQSLGTDQDHGGGQRTGRRNKARPVTFFTTDWVALVRDRVQGSQRKARRQ